MWIIIRLQMISNRIKGVHLHQLTEVSSGSGGCRHCKLCLPTGGRARGGRRLKGKGARWRFHLVDFVHEPSLIHQRQQLSTRWCRHTRCRKSQWQMWSSSGLHPDRDQGLPRCQPLEGHRWSLSTPPTRARTCMKIYTATNFSPGADPARVIVPIPLDLQAS